MFTKPLQPGDWVVYRKQKYSTSPGPRAKQVAAAPLGESYTYVVHKFWVVKQQVDDARVLLITRTGKEHTVRLADPNLRAARWWERWLYGERFRETEKLLV
ncbi:hypothetical protein [Aeoliella mucimassa]|uniref:Uncharacterized protein n=1 Tax=Aeoliella mucimassa TaxID=2527972 RepID=A0A518AI27_9BACT|nr:hypothetical protein [Aeoliella mucimassa]QDU54381.1 hypothetical protein Pan181_05620 [Aeoliella mucimassa]